MNFVQCGEKIKAQIRIPKFEDSFIKAYMDECKSIKDWSWYFNDEDEEEEEEEVE